MGLTTPLPDTVSLPVGADDVKMIDMVGANAVLANGGKRATPYAAIEIRNSAGDVDLHPRRPTGRRPSRCMPADKIAEMNNIMTHVLTEGTGRAAQIPGMSIAGKTGTTNDSTNAWFNGFTGNLVCSVWFGNDDNSPMTGAMTGGTLPAQTWHDIMAYAHQGLDTKPPYGVAAAPPGRRRRRRDARKAGRRGRSAAPSRPVAARRADHHRDRRLSARPRSTARSRRADALRGGADGGIRSRAQAPRTP